jgi:hypothetical protein
MNCERVRENHLDETLDHVQAVALISAPKGIDSAARWFVA